MAMAATSEIMQKIDEAEKAAYDNLSAVITIKRFMADNTVSDQYKTIFTKLGHMEEVLQNLQKESFKNNRNCISLQKTNDCLILKVQQLQEQKASLEIKLSRCKEVNKVLQEKVVEQLDLNSFKESSQAQARYVENNGPLSLKSSKNLDRVQAKMQRLNEHATFSLRQTSENACQSSSNINVIPPSSSSSKIQLQNQPIQSQIHQNIEKCSSSSESIATQSEGEQFLWGPLDQELQNQPSDLSLPSAMVKDATSLEKLENSLKKEKLNIIANLKEHIFKRTFTDFCKMHDLKQVNKYTSTGPKEMEVIICEMSIYVKELDRSFVATNHSYCRKQARASCSRLILQQMVEYGLVVPTIKPLLEKTKEVEKLNKLRSQTQWLNTHAASWLRKTSENESSSSQNATMVNPSSSFNPTPLQKQPVTLQNQQNLTAPLPSQQNTGMCIYNSETKMQETQGQRNGMSFPASMAQPVASRQEPKSRNRSKKKKNNMEKVVKKNASMYFTSFCNMHNLKPHWEITYNGPNKINTYTCELSVHVKQLGQTLFARKSERQQKGAKKSCAYYILLQMYCCGVKGITLGITEQQAIEVLRKNTEKSNSEIAINNIKTEVPDAENTNMETSNLKDIKMEIAKSIKKEIPDTECGEPMEKLEEKKSSIEYTVSDARTKFHHFCIMNEISPNFSYTQNESNSGFTCEISLPIQEHGQSLSAKEHCSSKKQARIACVKSILQQLYRSNNHGMDLD